ncbi:tRNA preQ1(34) S-adenosylmethionine ribosyltransferase-isomerase QueA [Planktotalea sp.]|uniref:tRNA preQ1(34) S-adenosylmethionine ribosyltransferase-isomerase QueA n=1 Tax=Planktotalea sp. TaxID=2029877 RepID=UPI003D6BA163
MKLSDFDFDLPEELIATRPVKPRSASRLLLAQGGVISDKHVYDLPDILQAGDVLVLNDTKVIPARLFGVRKRQSEHGSGEAKIEVTLLDPSAKQGAWRALIKPLRKVKEGESILFSDALSATLIAKEDGQGTLEFNVQGDAFDAALADAGAMPLPPYIAARRAADAQDKEDYQTVFAAHTGAVAAPTASLHFDDALLAELAKRGVEFAHVTLHVGAGTFLPVKVEDVTSHKMHAEWGQVSEKAAAQIAKAKSEGRRVIPVGTTALRLIESAAVQTGAITPWQGETDIFIYPGFTFHVADALMTNFHLPKSTLMMLVSALIGKQRVDHIYEHAIENGYRFFSYGDSSLLIPD